MRIVCLILLCLPGLLPQAHALSVQDDSQRTIQLDKPAQRVVTLAPFLTELLYSINAAESIVATVDYSDFPQQAKSIRRIGNYENFSIEQIIALQPDIVLAWQSANHPQHLQKLEELGVLVYRSEPRELADIATTLQRLGTLTGNVEKAARVADAFTAELKLLTERYAQKEKIGAFYQVWDKPIYTVNGQHIISKVMQICGITNVFADLDILAPVVTLEAVLNKKPQMIIASGMAEAQPQWLVTWRDWPELPAVKANNLFFIHPDLIQRHTLRLLEATLLMCEQGDAARRNLEKNRGQTH